MRQQLWKKPMPTKLTPAFLDMLKELGIEPQGTDRDPWAYTENQQISIALEKVADFPVARLPEVKAYAVQQPDGRAAVLDWRKLVAKMRSMMAEAPAETAGPYSTVKNKDGTTFKELNSGWFNTAPPDEIDDFIRDYYVKLMNRTPDGEHRERYRKVAS